MYYASFGMLALIIHFIINYGILRKTKLNTTGIQSTYKDFLFAVMVYYMVDVAWGFLYEWRILPLIYADTVLYFVTMALSVSPETFKIHNARHSYAAQSDYIGVYAFYCAEIRGSFKASSPGNRFFRHYDDCVHCASVALSVSAVLCYRLSAYNLSDSHICCCRRQARPPQGT